MKKVLFVVTEYVSANGVCAKAVMSEFVKHGHDVYCITNAENRRVKQNNVEGIHFCYVKPRMYTRVNTYLDKKRNSNIVKRVLRVVNVCINKLKLLLTLPIWPVVSPFYSRRIYREINRLCNQEGIDTIIPIHTKIDALIATSKFKKKNSEIVYIPYMLDSLSGGYGPKILSENWKIRRGVKWERRLFKNSDKVIMMQSSKAHYQKFCKDEEFFKKIVYLDIPLFLTRQTIANKGTVKKDGRVNLLFIGFLSEKIRPTKCFMDLFHSLEDENLILNIVGNISSAEYLNELAKIDNRIILHSQVSHDKAVEMMANADILINFGNNNPHMVPSKIFEYMSLGKPIISTAPIENEPSKKYLEKYPNSCVINYFLDLEINKKIMIDFINCQTNQKVDILKIKDKFYKNTPEAFYKECLK